MIFAVLVVLLTFFVVMPVMGNLWVDLDALRTALQVELRKTRELRREILIERNGGQ